MRRRSDDWLGRGQEIRGDGPGQGVGRRLAEGDVQLELGTVIIDDGVEIGEPAAGQDKPPNLYLSLALRACVLTNYTMGGGDGGSTESLSLSFTAINID